MPPWVYDVLGIAGALALVLLNGFFVAAEFALVTVRKGQVLRLVRDGRPFALTSQWLFDRLEPSLSACQLGITMASLALGWVGEPAFARMLEPVFHSVGIESEVAIHTASFIIAFGTITALHLVIGEQAPKIFAIRKPQIMLLWCAAPMKFFYVISYPLVIGLNVTTAFLLRRAGVHSPGHGTSHTEEEIRTLVSEAHGTGALSRAEHRLIHAVFEFDDTLCRRVMVPRSEVVFLDIVQPLEEWLAVAQRTKHTRYPVCEGSLDHVLGFAHIKDLIGIAPGSAFDPRSILRPPQRVPESMPISKLLRFFQASHQLLALVVDEHGTVLGIVSLEDVLEEIVGEVDDEFEEVERNILSEGPGRWRVAGSTPLDEAVDAFDLDHELADADTFSGLLTAMAGRILEVGDEIDLGGVRAEVLEVESGRALQVRVTRAQSEEPAADEDADGS